MWKAPYCLEVTVVVTHCTTDYYNHHRRARGRPRMRWIDYIKNSPKTLNGNNRSHQESTKRKFVSSSTPKEVKRRGKKKKWRRRIIMTAPESAVSICSCNSIGMIPSDTLRIRNNICRPNEMNKVLIWPSGWFSLNWVSKTGPGKVKAAGILLITSPRECRLVYENMGAKPIYTWYVYSCEKVPKLVSLHAPLTNLQNQLIITQWGKHYYL